MDNDTRVHRIKAMMHRFFMLYESGNEDFALVEELLFKEGFVWNSPSGNLIGLDAFKASFDALDKHFKHSHDAGEMTVELIDETRAKLSFDYVYQHLQGDHMALHAKGHYDIRCVDNGEAYPRIQTCDLTLLSLIEDGSFNDVLEQNTRLYLHHKARAEA